MDFIINLLPIELGEECRKIRVLHVRENGQFQGLKSKVVATVPTRKFFELLALSGLEEYIISYIEIAKDDFKENMQEAMFESYRQIRTIRKKYTAKVVIFDNRGSGGSRKKAFEDGMFSEQTLYLGNKKLKLALYARISKINDQPCIHSEFRIRGSSNIKDLLGIETFDDCYYLDIQQEYDELADKYIVFEEINIEKLGKWLLCWGRRKKFTRRQKNKAILAANAMLSIEGISSAAQLAEWFKNQKLRIKSQPGAKSNLDKKIMSVQSNCMFSAAVTL